MPTQRDPNRHAVMCYAQIDLLAKVRTAIKGRTVAKKTASSKTPSKSVREMGFSDFFIECVEKAVDGVTPSRDSLAWAKEQLAKNIVGRHADKIVAGSQAEKERQNHFQMKAYFEHKIDAAKAELEKMKSGRKTASAADVAERQERLDYLIRQHKKYVEACKAYADRRLRKQV